MTCPICKKRKAKRYCPARAENICSVCCGTEREVSIDCPSDCPYLIASREYDGERRVMDWNNVPFSEVRIPEGFATSHGELVAAITHTLLLFARDHRALVDSDAVAVLQTLAETYRTLSSGLYYERPPDYALQRELYEALKAALEEFKKREQEKFGMTRTRESEIRDALILLTQVGATRTNGRPKGRAFLDFMRSHLLPEEVGKPESKIILAP